MKKLISILLVLAFVFAFAACGLTDDTQGGENVEGDGYAPFVDVQGVTEDTILVGNTAATTGDYATVGVPFNAGMEAAFKE